MALLPQIGAGLPEQPRNIHSLCNARENRTPDTNCRAPARRSHLLRRKYENEWRAISGVDFKPARIINVSTARNKHTLFVTMPHPTAYGLTNAYFDAIVN